MRVLLAGAEELFNGDYAYFSSFSASWLAHSRAYVHEVVSRFGLDRSSLVVEVACNDGYLLQYVQDLGIPCVGIEPTRSTARAARARGLEVIEQFFGTALASRLVDGGRQADLLVANNVLAHVPDINDFVAGFSVLLKPTGVATFEFPHLISMVRESQFDTAYHEHFSYLSFTSARRICEANGLRVFDVQRLPTHGGSLRVFVQRSDTGELPDSQNVAALCIEEEAAGVNSAPFYAGFQHAAERVKNDFLRFLLDCRAAGRRVAAYGAAAKGNTLLNFCGVRPDLLAFVADLNPAKQGRFLPGSRIPVVDPLALTEARPDYIVLLPWNLRNELAAQLSHVREWGGRLVTAVPRLEVM